MTMSGMMMLGMMGFPLVFLGLIVAVAYALGSRPRFDQTRSAQTGQAALAILEARYAGGEITGEEYDQIRRDLEG